MWSRGHDRENAFGGARTRAQPERVARAARVGARLDVAAARRVLLCSGWSLCLWATWALVANLEQGVGPAARAAWTQGLVSLTITLMMTVTLERVSRACSGARARILLPTAAAVTLHAGYTIGLHWLAGTPALAVTVAPIILFGGLGYSLLYALALALLTGDRVPLPEPLARMARRVATRRRADRGATRARGRDADAIHDEKYISFRQPIPGARCGLQPHDMRLRGSRSA